MLDGGTLHEGLGLEVGLDAGLEIGLEVGLGLEVGFSLKDLSKHERLALSIFGYWVLYKEQAWIVPTIHCWVVGTNRNVM